MSGLAVSVFPHSSPLTCLRYRTASSLRSVMVEGRRQENLGLKCKWPTEVGHSNSLVSGGRLAPTSPKTHVQSIYPFFNVHHFFIDAGLIWHSQRTRSPP